MAKLKAHGAEIGTFDYATHRVRYMSDGHVLRNFGDGWKLFTKVKQGLNVRDVYESKRIAREEKLHRMPALRNYLNELFNATPLSLRNRLHTIISLMPDDCDGVWSECCDGYGNNVDATLDTITELCALYRAATAECKAQGVIPPC